MRPSDGSRQWLGYPSLPIASERRDPSSPCAFQMRRTALALMPLARAIRSAVQWVVSTGGSASVSATTRAATSGPSGGMREGRVLSCRRPAMPSFMNRSCQRQTQVFDLPVRRMISLVPTPSALERMIAARQACFCEALRSLVIASSRPRTDRVIVMENPGAHAPDLHGNRNRGIPIRTLLSGKDH